MESSRRSAVSDSASRQSGTVSALTSASVSQAQGPVTQEVCLGFYRSAITYAPLYVQLYTIVVTKHVRKRHLTPETQG